MQMAVLVARAAAARDVHRQHVLTGPDTEHVPVGNGGGQMQRLGVGQDRAAGRHHEHVDAVRQRDVAHPRRLGQPADAVELDPEDLGQTVAGDPRGVLKRNEAFVHADRRGVQRADGGDVVQCFAWLLVHDAKVFGGLYHVQGLLPGPGAVDIVKYALALGPLRLNIADTFDIAVHVAADLDRMHPIAAGAIAVQNLAGFLDGIRADR